jgi:hypothetical protein
MKGINRGNSKRVLERLTVALAVAVTAASGLGIGPLETEALAATTPTQLSPDAVAGPSDTVAAADELLTHVPTSFRDDCQAADVDSSDELKLGLTVAVTCTMSSSQGPEWAEFYQYETKAGMTKAFRSLTGGKLDNSDDCEKKEGETGWSINDQPMGIVACYISKGNYRVLVWTHDELKIVSIAGSKKLSFAKLTTWWKKAGPD